MRVVVIGATGHIGTYLIPMLVEGGFETIAVTRTMSKPYEDAPAWRQRSFHHGRLTCAMIYMRGIG